MAKRTSFLTLLALVAVAFTGWGAPVTPQQAAATASEFAGRHGGHRAPGASTTAPRLAYTAAGGAFYAFDMGTDAGFVMVAGDDRAPAVLAYVDHGHFDLDAMPPNARAWINNYRDEIAWLQAHPQAQGRRTVARDRVVSPLLTSVWDQTPPFNDQCPTFVDENDITRRTYAGCVASALAQIMKYHRWPLTGTGSNSYTCNVGRMGNQTLSRDFTQSTYDWDLIIDDYRNGAGTAEQRAEVAKLVADVGIGVNMDYINLTVGSSSSSSNAREGLVKYFDYDASALIVSRNTMSIDRWEELLVAELDAARPVYYSGQASDGGHAFVCDGYNTEGYFHFNWGWSGNSNGYFALTALNPNEQGIGSFAGGYNNLQEMIIGIRPNAGGSEQSIVDGFKLCVGSYMPYTSKATLGTQISMPIRNLTAYWSEKPALIYGGFDIYNEDGEEAQYALYNLTGLLDYPQGASLSLRVDFTPSTDLADGDYKIYFIYTTDAQNFEYAEPLVGNADYLNMTVADGVAYFSTAPSPAVLTLHSLDAPASVAQNATFEVNATLGCDADEYYDYVYLTLLPADGGDAALTSKAMCVDVPQGTTRTLTTRLTAGVEPGEYRLALLNNAREQVGDAVPVTVTAATTNNLTLVTDLQLAATTMPAEHVCGSATVRNDGEVAFYGQIQATITPVNGTSVLTRLYTPFITIDAGETVTIDFDGAHNRGVVGASYDMMLIDPNTTGTTQWGERHTFTVGTPVTAVTLAQLLAEGTVGNDYCIDTDLAVVEVDPDGNAYVTDGAGSWLCLIAGNTQLPAGLKGGSISGTYNKVNGNPELTLSTTPSATSAPSYAVRSYNLVERFAPSPCEVINVEGFYYPYAGTPRLRAYCVGTYGGGQSVDLDLGWCDAIGNLSTGASYRFHGVARLISAWDNDNAAAPHRVASDDPLAFQNYVVHATDVPAVLTGIEHVAAAPAGDHTVIYDTMGRRVTGTTTGGIYIIVNNGHVTKVAVP